MLTEGTFGEVVGVSIALRTSKTNTFPLLLPPKDKTFSSYPCPPPRSLPLPSWPRGLRGLCQNFPIPLLLPELFVTCCSLPLAVLGSPLRRLKPSTSPGKTTSGTRVKRREKCGAWA
jgi:hypothetical protein